MAPLPVDSTRRYKYTYQNAVAEHSIMFRTTSTADVNGIDAIMSALLVWFGDFSVESTVTGLEMAELGSNVFNPVSGSTVVGDTFGSTTANPANNAVAATWVGKGIDGRRSRFSLFGWKDAVSDYRVLVSEDADLGILIDFLNDPDNVLTVISGGTVLFKPYVDIKANDHWVREARS